MFIGLPDLFRKVLFNSHDIPKRKEVLQRDWKETQANMFPLTFNRQHMSGRHWCEISLLDIDYHTAPHTCVPLKAGCLNSLFAYQKIFLWKIHWFQQYSKSLTHLARFIQDLRK